jgi:hypothetical protein
VWRSALLALTYFFHNSRGTRGAAGLCNGALGLSLDNRAPDQKIGKIVFVGCDSLSVRENKTFTELSPSSDLVRYGENPRIAHAVFDLFFGCVEHLNRNLT